VIKRILLDIDDVCNQCTQYAMKWLGIPMDYERFYETYPIGHGYDIVATANMLLGHERFDVKSFWSMIPRVFWASCPPSAEMEMILARCVALVGEENVCFLTGPTKDPDCLAGKLEWIWRFAPEFMHRQYLIGPRKQFCAHHEALLIDDSAANVNTFREWGGQAVLVPRPWNTLHGVNTAEHLTFVLDSLEHEQTNPVVPAGVPALV
jgi:hypothetical protein